MENDWKLEKQNERNFKGTLEESLSIPLHKSQQFWEKNQLYVPIKKHSIYKASKSKNLPKDKHENERPSCEWCLLKKSLYTHFDSFSWIQNSKQTGIERKNRYEKQREKNFN